jgi:hypothetical protein
MSTQTDELDTQRTLNTLCAIEALRLLATPATEEDEDVRTFAQELCSNYSCAPPRISIMSNTELERLMEQSEVKRDLDVAKSANEMFQDIAAAAESAEARFCADYLCKMFAADYFERSNSKKVSLYHTLQLAIEAVALWEDDRSPAEGLATRISRAERYLFDMPNAALFRDAVICAFHESQFRDFSRLAEEIRKAEGAENLRRLAFRLIGPRKVVLDAEAKRLMNMSVLSRRTEEIGASPISRREISEALRRRKPR